MGVNVNLERDKFLTEAMGECWHEREHLGDGIMYSAYQCQHCQKEGFGIEQERNDFSSWTGFGKLWEWAQTQEWWTYFRDEVLSDKVHGCNWTEYSFDEEYVNPARFADAVFSFLLSR